MTNEEAKKILDSSFVWQKMVDEECEALGMAIKALDMAIKALEQEPCEDCISRHTVFTMIFDNKSYFKNDFAQGFFADKIMDLPPVTPQPTRWIPVSERLPEESMNSVIGWDAFQERCVFVQFFHGHFQIVGRAESFDIKAWMPLPESYKAESEE